MWKNAIKKINENEPEWLLENYSMSGRPAQSYFVNVGKFQLPVKHFGRLSAEIAGTKIIKNPYSKEFAEVFQQLGYEIEYSPARYDFNIAGKETKDCKMENVIYETIRLLVENGIKLKP